MFWFTKRDDGQQREQDFWIPERRLLAAVLQRAVSDFTGPDGRAAEEAAAWIFDKPEEPHGIFSFAWICEQLELDLAMVTEAIDRLPRDAQSFIELEGRAVSICK